MQLNIKKFIHRDRYFYIESTQNEYLFKDVTICYFCDKENLYVTLLLKHPEEKNNNKKIANQLVSERLDDYISGKSEIGTTISFQDFVDYVYDKEAWDVANFDMLNEFIDKNYIRQHLDFNAIKTIALERALVYNIRIEERLIKLIGKLVPSILKK